VARWACVDIPALPLQLLLQRHPDWAGIPAAVVDKDHPQGRLLWVNEQARGLGILPGMRYAAALALSRDLRAGVVDSGEIDRGVERLTARLRDFSPEVESCEDASGVFWLDGEGLGRLFASASKWGRDIHAAIRELGFTARVVVGFTRYGTYAVAVQAGANPSVVVFRDPVQEQQAARDTPLDRIGLDPRVRDDLDKLGVRTLREFLELPAGELHERFGEQTSQVHRMASGAAWAPLRPQHERERFVGRLELGYPDDDLPRLLFCVKQLLDPLLARLAARGEAVRALRVGLFLETRTTLEETVRPAAPTRDAAQLIDLVRLWLERAAPPAKVEEIEMEALGVPLAAEQRGLWVETPRRDPEAASRALARLRAEFGDASVVRARLVDGHLPEASFLWAPLAPATLDQNPAETAAPAEPSLVRRIFDRPAPLPPRPHHLRDDGWLIRGPGHGSVVKFTGPYVVSGGWWVRPVHREYHFAETQRGDLLWVYYDRERRRWFLQGRVE
jgi:protein ImuB